MKISYSWSSRRHRGPLGKLFDGALGIAIAAFVLAIVFFVVLPIVGVALTAVVGLVAGILVVLAISFPFLMMAKRKGLGKGQTEFSRLQNPVRSSTGRESLACPPQTVVHVENEVGSVQVLGVDGDALVVEALGGVPFDFEVGEGALFVQRRGSERVDLVVRLPRAEAIEVSLGSGDVGMRGLAGVSEVKLGAGRVEWDEVLGTKRARLGKGDVVGRRLEGDVDVKCGIGDVTLSYRNVGAAILVRTASGTLDLDLPHEARVSLRSTGCRVENAFPDENDGNMRVDMTAARGSVRIRRQSPAALEPG